MTITPDQSRAARALLNLSQSEISALTGIGQAKLSNFENPDKDYLLSTKLIIKLEAFYLAKNVEFIGMDGVRRKSGIETFTFEGQSGLHSFFDVVYEEALNPNGDFAIFNGVPSLLVKWAGSDWYQAHAERMVKAKNNYRFRVIIEEEEQNFIGKNFAEYRWIKKDDFNNETFYIFGNQVAYLSFGEKLKILTIKNEKIANSQRVLFNSVWDNQAMEIPDDIY